MVDVYADLLFIIDFCMDLSCLYMCCRMFGASLRPLRLILSAAVGGAYSVAALFIPEGAISVVSAAFFWLIICLIAFYRRGDGLLRQMKISLCYLAVNALLGGAVSALFGVLGRFADVCFPNTEYERADTGLRLIFLSLGLACLLLRLFVSKLHRLRLDKVEYVVINAFGKTLKLHAVPDTANFLCEPLTGTPCTVICKGDLVRLGGGELYSVLEGREPADSGGERIALIPAKTVSGEGILPGFFTRIALLDSEGKKIKECETVVAVSGAESLHDGTAILPECFV